MKKRKIAKILAATLGASTAIAVVSCGGKGSSNYTITYNSTQGVAPETVKGKEITANMLPTLTAEGYRFVGWYLDADFETEATEGKIKENVTLYAKWVQTVTLTFNSNGGSAVTAITVDKGAVATKPTDPTLADNTFGGWFTDEALTNPFSWDAVVNASQTLYAKWVAEGAASGTGIDIPEGYEEVTASLDLATVVAALGTGKTFDGAAYTAGMFTIDANKDLETRSRAKTWTKKSYSGFDYIDKYDDVDGNSTWTSTHSIKLVQAAGISFEAAGNGNCRAYVQNGSGSAGDTVVLQIKDKTAGTTTDLDFPAASDSNPMVQVSFDVIAGHEYQVLRRDSGTIDLYKIELDIAVEKADVSGIEITAAGTSKFFAGTEFNTTGLSVNAVKSNGASIAIDAAELTVDTSAVKMDTPGKYTIKVTYQGFEASYDVNVYALDDMELGLNKIVKLSKNTAAGNGQYYNYTAQQVYELNDEFSDAGLTVIGYDEGGNYLQRFTIGSEYVTVSELDTTTAGEKEVTITLTLNGVQKSETLTVYVVDTEVATVKDSSDAVVEANVYVDANYTGTIGAQVEYGTIGKTCNTFTTIQQALDYLGMQDGSLDAVRKNIYIAAGTYKEKLELTLPYTSLIGIAGAENTIIEWDSVYGVLDEGGYSHTTDSTQTIAVRDSAVGAVFDGLTISNYYNDITAYANTSYAGNGERALAMLAQADQMIVQNCRLLGWQDTLELFTGRQYFKDSYISGCVDYIFGTNNTTLFEGCEIHTVKSKTSNIDDTKTTAYVTAFKGCNKGDTDAITYGAIFNDCDFTVSDDFIGKIAVGRCWDKYSAVAILNSRLCDKMETTTSKAIVSMNANNTATTIQYWFYNNTKADGETAFTFTEDITTVTNHVLTSEQAANYINKAVIFGTANRGVTYNTAWDPSYSGVVVDTNVYYDFGAMSSTTGTVYTWDHAVGGAVNEEFGGLTINTNKCQSYGTYTEVQPGTMTITVAAGTTLSIKTGYSTNANLNIDGFISTTDTLTKYFETAQTVTINFTGKVYVLGIKVSTNEEAPEAITATSITATSAKSVFALNDTFETTGLIVNQYYSDGTYKVLGTDDYTVDSTAVKMDESGTYTVTITAGTLTATYDVQVGVDTSISEDTVLKFNNTYTGDVTNTVTWANNTVTGTQDGFTIAGSNYSNSGYLEFKNDDTITFDIAIPEGMKAVIVISGYQGVAPTVTVDTTNVAGTQTGSASHDIQFTYEITSSGTVTIAATTSQEYLNFVSITFVAA